MNKTFARLLAALFGLAAFAAACGDETTDATSAAPTTAPAADEAMGDMGEMEDEGHSHGHSEPIEVPDGMAIPEVSITLSADPMSGQNLTVSLDNFTIAPQNASNEAVDGEGHLHLYIDGERTARFYTTDLHLDLEPGEHTVMVEVSANSHSAYAIDGEPIRAMASITVPESDHMHLHNEPIEASDPVPEIALRVFEDPKSGWNLQVDLDNFTIAPQNASTEAVDGEGHLHLYIDGERQGRLYGSWWHVPTLSEGEHLIEVEVSANSHNAYAVDGVPIRAGVTVDVSAERATAETPQMSMDDADVVITAELVNGEVVVDDDRVVVNRDDVVALMITSDIGEHIHVHGYDLFAMVGPEAPAMLVFTANIPGVFEIEFEDSVTFITELEVS